MQFVWPNCISVWDFRGLFWGQHFVSLLMRNHANRWSQWVGHYVIIKNLRWSFFGTSDGYFNLVIIWPCLNFFTLLEIGTQKLPLMLGLPKLWITNESNGRFAENWNIHAENLNISWNRAQKFRRKMKAEDLIFNSDLFLKKYRFKIFEMTSTVNQSIE